MNAFTEAALKDVRYKVHPYRKSLLTHPKEWFESYGLKTPAKWKTHSKLTDSVHTEYLYPHYTSAYGWEWIGQTRHKAIKEKYGTTRTVR